MPCNHRVIDCLFDSGIVWSKQRMHFTLTRGMILDLPPDFIPRRRLFQFSMYPKTGISLFNIWLAGPVAVPEAAEYSAQDVAKPHPELRFTVMLSVLSISV